MHQGMDGTKETFRLWGCDLRQFGLHHCAMRMPFTLACLIHTRYCCPFDDLAQSLYGMGKQTNPTRARHCSVNGFIPTSPSSCSQTPDPFSTPTIPAQVWTKSYWSKPQCIYLYDMFLGWDIDKDTEHRNEPCMGQLGCYALWTIFGLHACRISECSRLAAKHGASAWRIQAIWCECSMDLCWIQTPDNWYQPQQISATNWVWNSHLRERYIIDTYTWVRDHYNPSQPLHQYAFCHYHGISCPLHYSARWKPPVSVQEMQTLTKTAQIARLFLVPRLERRGSWGLPHSLGWSQLHHCYLLEG